MRTEWPDQVVATDAALTALAQPRRPRTDRVMLFQSGGCCDGSSPICLPEGELLLGPDDLALGRVGGAALLLDREQYERWNRPRLVLDVAPGPAEGFSLEGLAGVHFRALSGSVAACEDRS